VINLSLTRAEFKFICETIEHEAELTEPSSDFGIAVVFPLNAKLWNIRRKYDLLTAKEQV
jgi:hypothetical protein